MCRESDTLQFTIAKAITLALIEQLQSQSRHFFSCIYNIWTRTQPRLPAAAELAAFITKCCTSTIGGWMQAGAGELSPGRSVLITS